MITSRKIQLLLLALDLAATVLIFNVVSYYRGLNVAFIVAPLFVPGALLVFAIYLIDGYQARTDMLSLDYACLHIVAVLSALLTTFLLTFAFLPGGYELQSSRLVIILGFLLLLPISLFYRRAIYLRTISNRAAQSFAFVGDRASAEIFSSECRKMEMRQSIIYCAADPSAADQSGPFRPFAEVLDEMKSGTVSLEAIVLRESNHDVAPDTAQRLIRLYFDGVPTYTLELFHQVYWRKIPLYRLNPTWLFQEGFQIAREPVFERLKRVSDLALSSIGLLLSAPLLVIAMVAIWLDDRGPVFFVQTRIGKNHVPFRLIKLRTMRRDAERGDVYTRPGDSRITRVGRFLRSVRLDELPQLWNVIRGEMSLIGPRAEWDLLVRDYERQISCYYYRHLVKPGITGWAQVNYRYGASVEDTLRKLEYDLYYIRNFSFLLDASIVLKTVQTVIFGKGR